MSGKKKNRKFLFVLTSCDTLGDTGKKTGFHYVEMTDPYYILQDHGIEVDLASIKGGQPPADPGSLKDKMEENEESVRRFLNDKDAMKKLKSTMKIEDVKVADYEGIYLPGGHGTMWDFPDNKALQKAVEYAWTHDRIVSAVCHGPAGLVNACDENGDPIVKNRRINCFTNEEEENIKKDNVVPFMLETKLKDQGGLFDKAGPFQAKMVGDSRLITGQNPPSASLVANEILRTLGISPYIKGATA